MVYQTDLSPAAQGGGVRYVQELIDFLLRNGWSISFLGAGNFSGKANPNLNFYRMCPNDVNWPYFFFGLFLFLLRHPNFPKTLIHVHRAYFAIPFLLLKPKAPIVCTLHGDTLLVLGGKSQILRLVVTPLFRLVELLSLRGIRRVIVVDERTATKFLGRYPFTWLKDKISIIPSAVDGRFFAKGDKSAARQYFGFGLDEEIVLFVGRLARIKNIPFLLRVFAKIEQQRPQARLVLAGDGDVKGSLIGYAQKLGIAQASFMGVVAHGDMPKLMQAADVLALCSHSEASPIVVKEAVACGLPVVTADVGDVSQVITSKDLGTMVNLDETAFCQALLERLEDADLGKENLTTEAPTPWQDFAADKMHGRIVEVYQDAGSLKN
jgi:glycosyltransferase involved in cell wall biosynthesis